MREVALFVGNGTRKKLICKLGLALHEFAGPISPERVH
jgi:hypothetical protein